MAGSRKTPISTPHLSRSNSVSREMTGKTSKSDPANGDSNVASASDVIDELAANSHLDQSPTQRNKKSKAAKRRRRKYNYLFDLLYHCLFIFFAIYTVSVCPTQAGPEHRLCRFVYGYRQYVIEPVLIRPVQLVLSHPAVSPIVVRIEPHLQRAIKSASPVVQRARIEWNHYISSHWNKRVIPQWRRHAVPHIRQLNRTLKPYLTRVVQEYNRRIVPSLRIARRYLRRYYRKALVHLNLLALKTYDSYKKAEPYAMTALRPFQSYIRHALLVLRTQRRRFVDPHVAKIREKVMELSSRQPKETAPSPPPGTSTTPHVTSIDSDVQQTPIDPFYTPVARKEPTDQPANPSGIPISDPPPPLEQATPAVEETVPPTDESASTSFEPSGVEPIATEASTSLETFMSISSLVSETVHDTPMVSLAMASLTEEIQLSAASVATAHKKSDPALDDFFADLGLMDEFPQKPVPNAAAATAQANAVETAEDEAEKLRLKTEETVMKRADITSRHTKWEAHIEELIESKTAELRKALVTMRKTAASGLKESKLIRGQVEFLDGEGEKYLKGTEAVFQNLLKEEKGGDDKQWSWSRVINRVEEKFADKTKQVEAVIKNWARELILREQDEVWQAQKLVQAAAERAQADLGLDYAWLDDVSYLDWQRYHDLARRSELFAEQATAIQNGDHPSSPINPVAAALEDLSSELEDLILGFQTRLRRIKRTADRTFNDAGQDGEVMDDDETATEPEFSILPVPGKEEPEEEENWQGVPPVFIGREEEEVLEGLGRFEADQADATSVERPDVARERPPQTESDSIVPTVADHVEL